VAQISPLPDLPERDHVAAGGLKATVGNLGLVAVALFGVFEGAS